MGVQRRQAKQSRQASKQAIIPNQSFNRVMTKARVRFVQKCSFLLACLLAFLRWVVVVVVAAAAVLESILMI